MNVKKARRLQGVFQAQAEPHTFIIRIWQERSIERGEPEWRGAIEHVGCKQSLHFFEGEGILRFIEERTGIRLRRAAPWQRRARAWMLRAGAWLQGLISRGRHDDG